MAPDPVRARTLSDELRGRTDDELVALLRLRPDLATPVPHDVNALAAAAGSPSSLSRALDRLDKFALQVVDVLCVVDEAASYRDIADALGADPAGGLTALRTLALVWGEDDALRMAGNIRRIVGSPAGLGPPLAELLASAGGTWVADVATNLGLPLVAGDTVRRDIAAVLTDAERVDGLVTQLSAAARELLDRLAGGPPTGRVDFADRRVVLAAVRSPVDELLARGLLVPAARDTVVLARELARHLRGGRVVRDPAPEPPPLETSQHDRDRVERTAGGAAFEAVRRTEELLETWGVAGPPALRTGGLGVRELRRSAASLDVEEHVAALLAETAHAAGLLGQDSGVDPVWAPTPAYDLWRAQPAESRWAALVTAWLEMSRVPGLVGTIDEKDKRLAALGPGLDRAFAPRLRAEVLGELAALSPGLVATEESLLARQIWRHPRRAGSRQDDQIRWVLREAELLGLTGLGGITAAGRVLLDEEDAGRPETAAATMAPLLPEPLDYVLLQADLTAVAPGPLTTRLGAELALAAEVESRSAATVYRFTESSVRRALDAGRSAAELNRLLAEHSRTPVPQPLRYLVDDVARRHGRIRVGSAKAYLRCDDPAVLSELLADRRAEQLRLRQLAPTVMSAQVSVETILERLRAIGYAPAAENPAGEVVVRRPDSRRAPARPRLPRLVAEPRALADGQLAAAVRALRRGEAARSRSGVPEQGDVRLRPSPAWETIRVLRTAAAEGQPVWIGYVNAEGHGSVRVIEPISVERGYVSAYDHLRDETRTFSLHRITGLAEVEG